MVNKSPHTLLSANSSLGDPESLAHMFNRDGYLFFEQVLSRTAVTEASNRMTRILVDHGVVEQGSPAPTWTGTSIDHRHAFRLAALHDEHIWQNLVQRPEVSVVFEQVFGEPVRFLPIASYQVKVPTTIATGADPFVGRHQDGFFSRGMEFRTCWLPLCEIDESLGGLALAPGFHHMGWLERSTSDGFEIPDGVIPHEAWRSARYFPGDLLIFHNRLPHCGLPNRTSSLVRISIDIRAQPASAPRPVIGELLVVEESRLLVRDRSGQTVELEVDQLSFLQRDSRRITASELREGELVIVSSSSEGTLIGLRPPTAIGDVWW